MSTDSIIKNRYILDEEELDSSSPGHAVQRENSGSGLVNTRISDRENEVVFISLFNCY